MIPPFRIDWLEEAKVDVRGLDRPTAMRVFDGILRFARSGFGDVVALQGEMAGSYRLRIGDYRVLFMVEQGAMQVVGVRHRSEAYR